MNAHIVAVNVAGESEWIHKKHNLLHEVLEDFNLNYDQVFDVQTLHWNVFWLSWNFTFYFFHSTKENLNTCGKFRVVYWSILRRTKTKSTSAKWRHVQSIITLKMPVKKHTKPAWVVMENHVFATFFDNIHNIWLMIQKDKKLSFTMVIISRRIIVDFT